MITIAQLAAAIGREYETVSNWRKRQGLMPYATKLGRDYLLAPDGAFRVHLAANLIGFMDVNEAFKVANDSPAVLKAIESFTNRDSAPTTFHLIVSPVKLRLKDGTSAKDHIVGLVSSTIESPAIDLTQAKGTFLETDQDEILTYSADGFRSLIIDLTELWGATFRALDALQRRGA